MPRIILFIVVVFFTSLYLNSCASSNRAYKKLVHLDTTCTVFKRYATTVKGYYKDTAYPTNYDLVQRCNQKRLRYFKKLNDCDKVDYIERVAIELDLGIGETFIADMARGISKKTGIGGPDLANYIGIYYSSDKLLEKDIELWREYLNCKK